MPSAPFEQRRDAFRVRLCGRARVERASGEIVEFELRDLSVTGAGLFNGPRLEVEERLTVVICLPEEEVVVEAEVVRRDAHGCGVRFGPIAPGAENRISRFLTDEQRRRVRPRA